MKQPENVKYAQRPLNIIHIKEAVYAQFVIHSYKMVDAFLAHIRTIGIYEQILVIIVLKLIFIVHKVRLVYVPKALHTNLTEDVLHATIHIFGMRLQKCVLVAQKLINLMLN